jgi:hypothetical protein
MQNIEFDSSTLFSCLKFPAGHYVSEASDEGVVLENKTGYKLAPCEQENWYRLDSQLSYASQELLMELYALSDLSTFCTRYGKVDRLF